MNPYEEQKLHMSAALALDMDSEQVDEALRQAGLDPEQCTFEQARYAVRNYGLSIPNVPASWITHPPQPAG